MKRILLLAAKRILLLAAVSLGCARPGFAAPIDLNEFLPEVEEAVKPNVVLRADGKLTITTPEKTTSDQLILIHRESNDLYIELQAAKYKLLLPQGGEAVRYIADTKEEARCAPDAQFDGTDFTCEDLQSFTASRYHTPRIVDQTPTQVQVAFFPNKSQYSLVVISFDREKKVPIKTMYYQETLNNLVKMRRDLDHVLVGRRWVPGKITMESFALRSTTTLDLRWSQGPNVPPELFQRELLSRPSNLTWPAP